MKYCKNCIYFRKYLDSELLQPVYACSRNLTPGGDYSNMNKDDNCTHYKRIWWKFWIK